MNSYELSRAFWNWAFDNPEKISPNHAAIYFFAIEHCNRLGWKKKFGFPSQMTMDAIGIRKHTTYIRYFNDLVDFGFFKLIEKSKNQYSSNIICLTNALPKKGQAMDKAMSMHGAKHGQKQKEYKQTSNQEQLNNVTAPTIEMCREYFDSRGYVEEFADKFFHYYNSLNWINKKGFEVSKVWRNSAELWFGDKDAIQYKKEEEMDAYEKQEAHIKKLKEEARRWG
jgi:hypothetical protein